MHKTLWTTSLLLIYCTSFLGQEFNKDTDKTFGLLNGHYWMKLSTEQRFFLLTGLVDGWAFREATEDTVKGSVILAWGIAGDNFQYIDMVKMIDLAYAEPENLTLPVGWVVMANMAVQRGDTTRDAALLALRKFLGGLKSGPPDRKFYGSEISPVNTILSLKTKP